MNEFPILAMLRFLLSPEDTTQGYADGPSTDAASGWRIAKITFWLILGVIAAMGIGQL